MVINSTVRNFDDDTVPIYHICEGNYLVVFTNFRLSAFFEPRPSPTHWSLTTVNEDFTSYENQAHYPLSPISIGDMSVWVCPEAHNSVPL